MRKKAFVDSQREFWGWQCSYRQALARVDQWLNPDDPHRFPVESLEDAVRVIGNADFLDDLLALDVRVRRESRRAIRKVEAAPRERRRSA